LWAKHHNTWEDLAQFKYLETFGEHLLYKVNTGRMPEEFVIKVETKTGQVHYDNNGNIGVNYRLQPYSGRGATALKGEGFVYKLPGIISSILLVAPQ